MADHATVAAMTEPTLMVGDIRVDGIVDGVGQFDPTKTFRNTSEELWESHQDLLDEDGRLGFTMGAFLVRTNGHTALIDSGLGDAAMLGITGGAMLDNLGALGVQPTDVTDVIYTHMHADHIGWSTVNGSSTFPNATHRCADADWQHFMVDTKDIDDAFPGSVNAPKNAFHHLEPITDQFETWSADGPLLPGVDVVAAPGHTPGSSLVVLSSAEERAMFLGDVVHCPIQLVDDDWEALFDVDPAQARKTRNALAAELEGSNTPLAPAHVPNLKFGRLIPAEGRRRWVVG